MKCFTNDKSNEGMTIKKEIKSFQEANENYVNLKDDIAFIEDETGRMRVDLSNTVYSCDFL